MKIPSSISPIVVTQEPTIGSLIATTQELTVRKVEALQCSIRTNNKRREEVDAHEHAKETIGSEKQVAPQEPTREKPIVEAIPS